MKPKLLAAGLILGLGLAGAAQAEKWTYFPVPGGALAYETDNRKIDLSTGQTEGDVLTYYFVPQALRQNAYVVMVERLDFRCRGDQYRIMGTVYFDAQNRVVGNTDAGPWTTVPARGSPIAAFQHAFCTAERPAAALEAGDVDTLLPLLRALPPTSVRGKPGAAQPPASITLPAAKPVP